MIAKTLILASGTSLISAFCFTLTNLRLSILVDLAKHMKLLVLVNTFPNLPRDEVQSLQEKLLPKLETLFAEIGDYRIKLFEIFSSLSFALVNAMQTLLKNGVSILLWYPEQLISTWYLFCSTNYPSAVQSK